VDDDFDKPVMKSSGPTLRTYRAMRKGFCRLFKVLDVSKLNLAMVREMEVELVTEGDGVAARRGAYGYASLGGQEFVHVRRSILVLMCVAVLEALNVDHVLLGIAQVDNMDWSTYGTSSPEFETVLFTMMSYDMYSSDDVLLTNVRQEIKDLRELVQKERQYERGLTHKGICTPTGLRS